MMFGVAEFLQNFLKPFLTSSNVLNVKKSLNFVKKIEVNSNLL